MANAAGMACRVICSAAFIRRFFLEDTGALPLLQQRGQKNKKILEPAERTPSQTLWRRVIAGALPHPLVVAALTISSVVAHGTSPYSRSPLDGVFTVGGDGSEGDPGMPWDMKAAAKHVGVGGLCFVFTAAVFRRFEHRFLMELRALWAARR